VKAGTRLQFDFSPEMVSKLDGLKEKMGAASRAEVIRRALYLLGLAVDGDLKLKKKDGDRYRTLTVV